MPIHLKSFRLNLYGNHLGENDENARYLREGIK